MKKLLIISFIVFAAGYSPAQVSRFQGLVQEANQYYSDSKYTEAIAAYEEVLAGNYESAALYFNLGNAYFKVNNIPSAIWNYEKALKLDPTDKDIRFNLDLANSRVIDKIEPLPEFFLKTWIRSLRDMASSNSWAKIGLFTMVLALAFAFIFTISRSISFRKISFWSGLVMLFIMGLAFIFSTSSYRHYHRQNTGIIFNPTVTVKSSPSENSVDLFVIHEGAKVFILDRVEGWSEIKLANGNVGWLKTTSYKPV